MKTFLLFAAMLALFVAGCDRRTVTEDDGTLRYPELVSRLLDLRRLASLPAAGERSAMWSSYDRRSRFVPDSGYVNWSANDDGFHPQYIRKEGDNMVLAEMTGPGAIVRMWSANPGKGKVKIYVDGEETPVIDESFRDYFSGRLAAFDFPSLVYETKARGFNNYVPIPYARSCRIVAEPEWGQYYHFNYITFPAGTKVESFTREPARAALEALERVDDFLSRRVGEDPYEKSSPQRDSVSATLAVNQRLKVFELTGPRAITALRIRLTAPNSIKMAETLRKVTLQIRWDDEAAPAVWAPLGDFFGSAPGLNAYKTLAMSVDEDGMSSYWYMPFASAAEISLQNDFTEPVQLAAEVVHEAVGGDVAGLGRFHAKWHRDLPVKVDSSRWPDWPLLEIEGKGRFVGMALSVWNPKGGSCKAYGGEGHYWWGEGDEKFFVDGEQFPSTFGTGTEDYFGYAWCSPDRFEHAFHSQSIDSDNMGYQSVNRWQIIDNVPFQQSFDAYLEKYFPNGWPTQYAVMVYWYMQPGGVDPLPAIAAAERFGFEKPFTVYRERGVIEGEAMPIEENSGGWATTDVWVDEALFPRVSNHKALKWYAKQDKEGRLSVSFFWPEDGTYEVEMQIVQAPDGGEFDVSLNGRALKPVSFASRGKEQSPAVVKLGTIDIRGGKQQVLFRWPQREGNGNHLQVDFLRLKKVRQSQGS